MSGGEIDVSFEREAFALENEDDSFKSRWRCCPSGRSDGSKFLIACCLPFTWMCWVPSRNSFSKGGVLLGFSLCYLLLGALFFWGVEGANECQQAGIPFGQQTKWTYGSSVYFVFIALTTIGYGDYFPTLVGSKVFFMFYAAIGCSLLACSLGYLSASVSQFIENTEVRSADNLRKCRCPESFISRVVPIRLWLYIGGTYIFALLLGAVLFGYAVPFNNPEYLNGMYFTFVTLATIGFGDLLPKSGGTKLWCVIVSVLGVSLFSFMVGAASATATRMAGGNGKKTEYAPKNNSLRDALKLLDDAAAVTLSEQDRALLLSHVNTIFRK